MREGIRRLLMAAVLLGVVGSADARAGQPDRTHQRHA